MTTTPRASVNQQVQIGKESTPGTGVPGAKVLGGLTWTMGLKPTTKQFTGTGRQYPSASALLMEQSEGKIAGPGDFAQLAYVFGSHWGSGSPALHSPSTTAYDFIWTPSLTAAYSTSALTYTVMVGDVVDAEQYTYVVFNGFTYKFTRKQEVTIDGDLFAQTFTDGITLTASPTLIEQVPMTGAQANVYLDSTSGGIGGTKLTDILSFEFKADKYYDPYWAINRSNASFSNIVDLVKKHTVSLKLAANTTGIAPKGTYLETGAKVYLRVDIQGPLIDVGNSIKAQMTHDMCCLVADMKPFGDVDGVYGVEYTLIVAEDSAWNSGQAQKMTLTNLLTAIL